MQRTIQNLSLAMDNSTHFEDDIDGLATSISSSFTSAGCVTPATITSYISCRPPGASPSSFLQYMSGPSSDNSGSPTTPVGMSSFNLEASIYDPARLGLANIFEDFPMTHGLVDNDIPSLSLADTTPKPETSWDALGYAGGYMIGVPNMYTDSMSDTIPVQPMIPQQPRENQWCSEAVYNTCPQPTSGACLMGSLGLQQPEQTIVPSQTLVEQPSTPFIKTEPLDLRLPTLPPPLDAVAKKVRTASTGRVRKFSKCPSGIARISGYHTSRKSGRVLPYSDVAERRRVVDDLEVPRDMHACDRAKADGTKCGKLFKRKEHLTRHKKTHDGKNTDKCFFCDREIKAEREDNMKTHVEKTHIKETPSGRNKRHWLNPVTKKEERITYELLRRLKLDARWKVKAKL